jgi:hypothetical protein
LSWASHWHYRHDIADKILAAAHPETDESGSNDPDDADVSVDGNEDRGLSAKRSREPKPRKRHRKYIDASESSSDSESSSSSYRASDDDGLDVSTGEDEERMAQGGPVFNRADIRMMARHVAGTKNWDDLGSKERWNPFNDRVSLFWTIFAWFDISTCFSFRNGPTRIGRKVIGSIKKARILI